MGHVWVKVRLGDPAGTKIIEVDALVDTGATLTVIPRRLANELNLSVTGKTLVETGAGRLELDRSRAWIEILGRGDIIPVLVSDIIDKVSIFQFYRRSLGGVTDPLLLSLSRGSGLLIYHRLGDVDLASCVQRIY